MQLDGLTSEISTGLAAAVLSDAREDSSMLLHSTDIAKMELRHALRRLTGSREAEKEACRVHTRDLINFSAKRLSYNQSPVYLQNNLMYQQGLTI